MRWAVAIVALAGCSKILGINDLTGPGSKSDGGASDSTRDTPATSDGPASDGLPGQIRVSGTLKINDGVNQSVGGGNQIEFIRTADNVSIAQGTVDTSGQYMLMVPTVNGQVTGNVHVRPISTSQLDTFQYFARPLAMDTGADVVVFTRNGVQTVANLANVNQGQNNSWAIATVGGPPGTPVRYLGPSGQPDTSLTSTSGVGQAIVFDVISPSQAVVSAMLLGSNPVSVTFQVSTAATYAIALAL
jgi:hypothetical protein